MTLKNPLRSLSSSTTYEKCALGPCSIIHENLFHCIGQPLISEQIRDPHPTKASLRMPLTTISSYTSQQAVITLFFTSRGTEEVVIERILWAKLEEELSPDAIKIIVRLLQQRLRNEDYNGVYNESANQWDREAVKHWLLDRLGVTEQEFTNMITIDAATIDAIGGVSTRMPLQNTSVW